MELLTWHDFITQNKAFNLVVDAAREIFVAFHLANSGSPEEETLCRWIYHAKLYAKRNLSDLYPFVNIGFLGVKC